MQRDPVSGLDAGRDQALGQARYLGRNCPAVTSCQLPAALRRRSMTSSGSAAGPAEDDIGQAGIVRDFDQGRDPELEH